MSEMLWALPRAPLGPLDPRASIKCKDPKGPALTSITSSSFSFFSPSPSIFSSSFIFAPPASASASATKLINVSAAQIPSGTRA